MRIRIALIALGIMGFISLPAKTAAVYCELHEKVDLQLVSRTVNGVEQDIDTGEWGGLLQAVTEDLIQFTVGSSGVVSVEGNFLIEGGTVDDFTR